MRVLVRISHVKRPIAFILALFYLTSSIGGTLHQHYCMGELVGASFLTTNGDECSKCGMNKHLLAENAKQAESDSGCCKDVSIVIRTGDYHTFSPATYGINSFTSLLPAITTNFAFAPAPVATKKEKIHGTHSPPLLNPLFLQFRNIRI